MTFRDAGYQKMLSTSLSQLKKKIESQSKAASLVEELFVEHQSFRPKSGRRCLLMLALVLVVLIKGTGTGVGWAASKSRLEMQ